MAVEAHHLLHTGGAAGQRQLLAHAGWAWAGDGACCEAVPASAARLGQRSPCYGGGREVVAAGRPAVQQQGFQQSCVVTPAAPSATAAGQLVMPGQYSAGPRMCAPDGSDSGVTSFGGGGGSAQQDVVMMTMARTKRKRADERQAPAVLGLATADVAAHFHRQMVDVDHIVLQHTTKMWTELREQRRRHAGQIVVAMEAAAAKRLRAKEEEIGRIGRLNCALEERLKTLYMEVQVWRDLAQSNEAAANAFRGELQQALDAQQARGDVLADPGAGGTDDAGSCCCGENDVAGAEADINEGCRRRMCTVCGEGAAEVLMLPCRHLCACAPCAGASRACPACGCAKNGSVCINFS
ncbi:putative BOI-related E3 ubiquitin-protein ligase 3 [Dichanthelium oligosanthes]|uniref:Putative BOI-related E3 ubiquitin-protein ligase 3 n=1 Tax=Dichanthelium oligosanthes TaxID=888268 RepID=A0A1E5VY10_9POAL|nr:putative BOI-related E3 ubiquitin-protein ligase 3 [Dichanthelium oligosanthes]